MGYGAAIALPVAITYTVAVLQLPSFVFEHLVVLLVIAVAVPWGIGPAIVTTITSVLSDNILLREPVGAATITGVRDILDLALFAIVAVVISHLVRRAHLARLDAQLAAERERGAREQRDRLIATVTHDLATPLSVMNGTLQMIRGGHGSERHLPRLLTRLETASARATSLLRTLSDVRALESHSFTLHPEVVDLRAVVVPIAEMMDRLSDRHPVVVNVPDESVMIQADSDRLQRVVENLISNAIKYSPDGGAVEVSITVTDQEAVLRVRDRGIGIAQTSLPHIFDAAYRAPEATAFAPGLGLGLSIAAEVVTRHGGRIDATPVAGGGTVFAVTLPVTPVVAGVRP